MRGFLTKSVLFLAGLAVLCMALQRADTYSDIDVVGPKMRYFTGHKDDYDVVFVGSSYVYREISPALFDQELAGRGTKLRSFNLGVPGMDPPETYFLATEVMAARPAKLKYLVVELDYYERLVRNRTLHTRRFDYWHTPDRTVEAIRALSESNVPRTKQIKDAARHAEAGTRKFLSVGRGRTLIESAAHRLGLMAGPDAVLGADQDGFRALDDEDSEMWEARAGLFEAFEEGSFEEKLARLKDDLAAGRSRKGQVTDVDSKALSDLLAAARAGNIRVIMIVPPCMMPRLDLIALGDKGIVEDLLVFNDPNLYPEFYELSVRFDPGHLNKQGAHLFTRRLADRFAALLKSAP